MHRRLAVLDAHAVVFHDHPDAPLLDCQAHVGAARVRVMLHVGQGLAHHLQHVDLLARVQFVAEQVVVKPEVHSGALRELADGVPQRIGKPAPVHAKTECREQFPQLAIGVVEAHLEIVEDIGDLRARAIAVQMRLEADHLDLEVGQRLREGVVQLARDGRALLHERDAAPLVGALGGGERSADMVADRSQQFLLPLLDFHAGRQPQQHYAVGLAPFDQGHREHAFLAAAHGAHAGLTLAEAIVATFQRAPGAGPLAAQPFGPERDGKAAPVAFLAGTDGDRLEADDALRVAHHPGERRLGGWILGQRACGVVQDFQRDVAARELLRLLLDPGLEGGVAAGKIGHHVVERLPELPEFVLAHVLRAHREIPGAHAPGTLQQVGKRHDGLRMHEVQGDEHDHDDREQRGPLYRPQRLDAPFQIVLEQVRQPVHIEYVGGHARDECISGRRTRDHGAGDGGLERVGPGGRHAFVRAVGGVVGIGRQAADQLRAVEP